VNVEVADRRVFDEYAYFEQIFGSMLGYGPVGPGVCPHRVVLRGGDWRRQMTLAPMIRLLLSKPLRHHISRREYPGVERLRLYLDALADNGEHPST
jgi:hypothetical protein